MIVYVLSVTEEIYVIGEPMTYSETVSCNDSTKWLIAMNEKIEKFYWNRTWILVKPFPDKKIVGCKWIFKKNEGIPRIENTRYKVRLVAKGYNHVQDVNFNEIFSPVVKHNSIRVLLALIVMYDLELE